jgi:hypothetical protein
MVHIFPCYVRLLEDLCQPDVLGHANQTICLQTPGNWVYESRCSYWRWSCSSSRFQKYLIITVHVVCSGRTVLFLWSHDTATKVIDIRDGSSHLWNYQNLRFIHIQLYQLWLRVSRGPAFWPISIWGLFTSSIIQPRSQFIITLQARWVGGAAAISCLGSPFI